jgi:hypothetical protein
MAGRLVPDLIDHEAEDVFQVVSQDFTRVDVTHLLAALLEAHACDQVTELLQPTSLLQVGDA